MGDDPINGAPDEAAFAPRPETREFLKNESRNHKGEIVFLKLNTPYKFSVLDWEWYTPADKPKQKALIVTEPKGKEFLYPLGSSSEWIISDAGVSHPDQLKGAVLMIELYETGSTGKFAKGKRITSISLPVDVE